MRGGGSLVTSLGRRMADRMACRTCRQPLNVFTHADGVEYIHARAWAEHNHEPDPIPLADGEVEWVCDFCTDGEVTYAFYGARVSTVIPGFGGANDTNGRWAACDQCAAYVRRGDIEGLVQHVMRTSPHASKETDVARRQYFFEYLTAMFSQYVPSVFRWERVTKPAPVTPLVAARMPRYRDALVRYWRSDLCHRIVATSADSDDPMFLPGDVVGRPDAFGTLAPYITLDEARRHCVDLGDSLAKAELYWVSAEFSVIAVKAGLALPDTTVREDELPARHGLICYAQPVAEDAGGRPIIAVSWSITPLGVWVVGYIQPEASLRTVDRQKIRDDIGYLLPITTGGGIAFDETLTARHDVRGLFRSLLATWFLLKQPGVVEPDAEVEVEPAIRKRYAREKRPQPKVHLVDLRRRPRKKRDADDGEERTERVYSVRWIVGGKTGGFWRDYRVGPGRKGRERKWIMPYVAGPDDKPLRDDGAVPTVKVLR